MNIQTLTELWVEMAGHLQAALTLIEVVLLDGPNEALEGVARETMSAWRAFETRARPVLEANGHVGPGPEAES